MPTKGMAPVTMTAAAITLRRHDGSPEAATDPVCGMKVDPATSKHRFEHEGRTFHFCSARCREKFIAAPARYLTKSEKAASPVPKGTIYTCPMHPQIRQDRAGQLPDLRHGAGAA